MTNYLTSNGWQLRMTSACWNSRLLPTWCESTAHTFFLSLYAALKTFLIVVVVVNHICLIWWSIQKFRLSSSDQQPTNVNKLFDLRFGGLFSPFEGKTWLTVYVIYERLLTRKEKKKKICEKKIEKKNSSK